MALALSVLVSVVNPVGMATGAADTFEAAVAGDAMCKMAPDFVAAIKIRLAIPMAPLAATKVRATQPTSNPVVTVQANISCIRLPCTVRLPNAPPSVAPPASVALVVVFTCAVSHCEVFRATKWSICFTRK